METRKCLEAEWGGWWCQARGAQSRVDVGDAEDGGLTRSVTFFVCCHNFSVFGDFPTLPEAIVFCCSSPTLEIL